MLCSKCNINYHMKNETMCPPCLVTTLKNKLQTAKEKSVTKQDLEQLRLIARSVKNHYEDPYIASNGKAEGLCLAVRGLGGLIAKYDNRGGHNEKKEAL